MLDRSTTTQIAAMGMILAIVVSGCRVLPGDSIRHLPAAASPYDHGGPELAPTVAPIEVIPSQAPVVYRKAFENERDSLGYSPRFLPTGAVVFDPSGAPYIRASRPDRDEGDGSEDGFIQVLDAKSRRWQVYSLVEVLRRHLGVSGIRIGTGVRAYDTRVLCDAAGDLYTVVRVTTPLKQAFLLHRQAASGAWGCYPLPMGGRLEPAGTSAARPARPPLFIGHLEARPSFILIEKTRAGRLRLAPPVPFAPAGAGLNPAHSGAGAIAATVNNRTYFVYAGADPLPRTGQPTPGAPFRSARLAEADEGPHHPGTPQFVVYYDHHSHSVSAPVLLGFGQNPYSPTPDNHNCPAIVADSHGRLHVVLGAHQHHFWYIRSLTSTPDTRADWTAPEALGWRRHYDCGLTYVALVIDSRDRLHLVARNMSRGYAPDGTPLPADDMNAKSMMRTLDYLRAIPQPDGTWKWEEQGALVMPLWHRGYSIFYHKLNVDSHDRLFLTYSYYAAQLDAEAIAVYRDKWPEENIPDPPPTGLWMKPHDPAMLMSDDAGATWRLTTTQDLLDTMPAQ